VQLKSPGKKEWHIYLNVKCEEPEGGAGACIRGPHNLLFPTPKYISPQFEATLSTI